MKAKSFLVRELDIHNVKLKNLRYIFGEHWNQSLISTSIFRIYNTILSNFSEKKSKNKTI